MTGLQWGQLGFALFVLGLIAERAKVLLLDAPISEEALRWLCDRLREGAYEQVRAWAGLRPRTHAARVLRVACGEGEDEELSELLLDLKQEASARLLVLRVSATLASTLGLLGGIVALRRALGGEAGLTALKAGLPQRMGFSEALLSMAIGVATSAVCFYAVGVFRRSAMTLVAQSARLSHLAGESA